jgi:hypothetical protein
MKNLNVKTFNATSSDLTLKDLVAFYNEHCHLLEKATVKKFATRAIAEKRVQEVQKYIANNNAKAEVKVAKLYMAYNHNGVELLKNPMLLHEAKAEAVAYSRATSNKSTVSEFKKDTKPAIKIVEKVPAIKAEPKEMPNAYDASDLSRQPDTTKGTGYKGINWAPRDNFFLVYGKNPSAKGRKYLGITKDLQEAINMQDKFYAIAQVK